MRRWLWCLILITAACGQSEIERYGSGWSMGIRPAADEVAGSVARTQALVDSLQSEGYRVIERRQNTFVRDRQSFESRGWTLEGRHPDLGRIRIVIDASTDPLADPPLHLGVRFASPDLQHSARTAFEDRFMTAGRGT